MEDQVPHKQEPAIITSTPAHLKLLEYRPESYAGIANPASSVVVVFPDDWKAMKFHGDQGTNKSSSLACLRALFGGDEVENAINSTTGTKKAELCFEVGGNKYISRINKSGFSLIELQDIAGTKKPIRKDVREPKTFLKSLIGPLGTDPHFIKGKNPKEQLKWLRDMMPVDAEIGLAESEINELINKTYSQRTDINRTIKFHKSELIDTSYFTWDAKAKALRPTAQFESDKSLLGLLEDENLEKEYHAALSEWQEYGQRQALVSVKERRIVNVTDRLEALKRELALMGEELLEATEDRDLNNRFLEEKKGAEQRFQEAKKAIDGHAQDKYRRQTYEGVITRKEQFDKSVAQADMLSKKLDELVEQRAKFIRSITPNVDGLEVCIPRQVDPNYEREAFMFNNPEASPEEVQAHLTGLQAELREGIYFKNRSVSEMSESELWDMWLSLIQAVGGVRAVFIENITSLGSAAIDRINTLANAGCYVFFSAMERGVKELKVSFINTGIE